METLNNPDAPEIKVTDQYGEMVYPNDVNATAIYREVCVEDTYGFKALKKSGFKALEAIDLGASYGVASRMIRYHWRFSRILAYEPDALRFSYLIRNCPGIECRNYGVAGFAHDPNRLRAGIGLDGKWRKNPESVIASAGTNQLLSVGEAFMGNENIDLLKIDVEGFELGIIQEMKEMGLLARTRVIVGEWHFENARIGLIEAFKDTHNFEHKNPPNSNPWNSFRATLKT